jgi:hypothetical protein
VGAMGKKRQKGQHKENGLWSSLTFTRYALNVYFIWRVAHPNLRLS